MEKRMDLEKQLARLSQARDKIEQQLSEAETRVTQLQIVVNSEFMEHGQSGTLQELSLTRERVTSLHQTQQYANDQVAESRRLLEDFDRAAKGGQVIELVKKLQSQIVEIQDSIGEKGGIKGKLDQIYDLTVQLDGLQPGHVMDAEMIISQARNIYVDLTRSLLDYWKRIEDLKWGPSHYTQENKQGYLSGFGRLP
jgi:hypothetical protein